MRESQLQSNILKLLRSYGIACWRIQTTGIWDASRKIFRSSVSKGVADILGLTNEGRFFAIEVKSTKGKVSDEQQKFLDEVSSKGGITIVARSIEDVAKEFNIQRKVG